MMTTKLPSLVILINSIKIYWIVLIFTAANSCTAGEIIFRVDPLALLSATLRTYQKTACDTEQISLSCPRGTSISIEIAQYGRAEGTEDGITVEELCPLEESSTAGTSSSLSLSFSTIGTSYSNNNSNGSSGSITAAINKNELIPKQNLTSSSSSTSSNFISAKVNSNTSNNTIKAGIIESTNNQSDSSASPDNCMWPNALQYSLLQTVVEACQKKKHCKFNAPSASYRKAIGSNNIESPSSGTSNFHGSSSTSINLDPCPKVRKFVEIAYKCRPYEFRSKVACANDVIQLECNPYSRIAVYSASFGRTEYESIQCPQPQGVKEETCLASYATETVMQICHGRRRCNLSADSSTFGSPCSPNSRMYLKVVYTCVPKQVLKDRYESDLEPDENEHFDGDTNDLYDEDQFYKESEAVPKLQSNFTRNGNDTSTSLATDTPSDTTSNPIITHSKSTDLEEDQERFYLYLLIAGLCGVLLCIIIVVVRVIIIQKRRDQSENGSSSSQKGETTIPNGFNDSISEIDADIDLTTPVPLPSVSKNENFITYGPSAGLYSNLGPSNVSHTSSTMLLPTANSLMCARQSPDIIGVSNTFIGQPASVAHVSSPSNTIGTLAPIASLSHFGPLSSTFHHSPLNYSSTSNTTSNSYNLDSPSDSLLFRRPIISSSIQHQSAGNIPQQLQQQHLPVAISLGGANVSNSSVVVGGVNSSMVGGAYVPTSIHLNTGTGATINSSSILTGEQQQQQQQQNKLLQYNRPLSPPSSVSTASSSAFGQPLPPLLPPSSSQSTQLETFHSDGIAPRTLSTGVPHNSQFYYG